MNRDTKIIVMIALAILCGYLFGRQAGIIFAIGELIGFSL